jgi:hypothetical protein
MDVDPPEEPIETTEDENPGSDEEVVRDPNADPEGEPSDPEGEPSDSEEESGEEEANDEEKEPAAMTEEEVLEYAGYDDL